MTPSLRFALIALSLFVAMPLSAARKVVLEKAGEGGGYRWKIIDVAMPSIGDDEVLVRVHAVGLNRGDLDGLEPDSERDRTGHVPGSDAAGEVVAVGKRVKMIRKGARVTNTYFKGWSGGPFASEYLNKGRGWTADGVLGEYLVLAESDVVPIPDGLTYEEAATLPTAALTAWNAVAGYRDIHSGDVVLVQGTGGVSTFATQFAAALGARVIVTSSSDEKLARAKTLGAHDGINYKREPLWSERVLQLTNGHGADLIVDVGGKDTLDQSVKSLADAGSLSIVGGLSGYDGNVSAWGLLKRSARAQGVFVGSRADYLRMNELIAKKKLHPVIDRVLPLEQFDEALKALQSGSFVGKIVLTL
jgi:NADPH:quinone reductase-like Zn-dependent oxidoreductase